LERKLKKTILIIDDDEKLNRLLTDYLGNQGYLVLTATHPDDGLKKLKSQSPHLIILDIMLPDMNGFEVCKIIRRSSTVPILMLTARGEVTDKVVGLELGADDYLAKPFEPRELVARIQSILRRTGQTVMTTKRRFGSLVVNFQKRIAYLENEPLDLTTTEFEALSLLVENPGAVLSRDQIMDALRGVECEAFNRSIDIAMSRLRQKLKDNPRFPVFIKTVWGTGYVFIAEETDDGP
jgi:DNA-binding response OmpR family regulator